MPGKVKVKIVSGRNLPVMDRSNLTTDAYVEVKMGSTVYKTDVYRKSLNPVWNSEWFRFEMDDLELQDEPLQIRLMDHDTYSSNDAIGKVYLDLNPLLCNSSRGKDTSGKIISGWIPVYDTMHGIRGEVNLIVKVELFSDLNKFRQSSCGVRFFFTQSVPEGYVAHIMQGFVEELVVNDDPEYQWIDKIRTPRASNEARQTLFSKLSGEVQRRVGLKALELGGNSVIGYKQCFDLEGESGIVVRGIGTAAYLTKQYESQLSPTCTGEALGLSREFAELQGYRSFSKNSRSLRRRGGPGRAPRLQQRRSFRLPNSSDSMVTERHPSTSTSGQLLRSMPPDAVAVVNDQGCCCKQERSSSFREDSVLKLAKLNLQKSLTSSNRHLNVTSSEPCIKSGCSAVINIRSGEGATLCPSNTTALPCPLSKCSKSVSPLPHHNNSCSTFTFRSRSTSRLSHSNSPLRKPRNVECSPVIIENEDGGGGGHHEPFHHPQENTNTHTPTALAQEGRSQSALASCTHYHHHRANSETMSPAMSSQTIRNEASRQLSHFSKSVSELNTTTGIPTILGGTNQLLGSLGGSGGELESADDDSTSDTSMRYIYDAHSLPHAHHQQHHLHHHHGNLHQHPHPHLHRHHSDRFSRREVEVESDTSKECARAHHKISSGNDACSVGNDELSQVSDRDGFLLLKKKKGSRRKDRYSKSSLMKRAGATFSERGIFGGTEKIREEVVKFFKRKKSIEDNESCSSSTKNASLVNVGGGSKKWPKTAKSSPYREAKFFFRRRRVNTNPHKNNNPGSSSSNSNNNPPALGERCKSSSQLFRSNSDSHSLGQTSLDSMPSVGSEPLFDPDDDNSSRENTNLITGEMCPQEKSPLTLPNQKIDVDVDGATCFTKCHSAMSSGVASSSPQLLSNQNQGFPPSLTTNQTSASPTNIVKVSKSKIVEIIEELGYSTASPLKLYISSMDALLIYDPSEETDLSHVSADNRPSGAFNLACSSASPAKCPCDKCCNCNHSRASSDFVVGGCCAAASAHAKVSFSTLSQQASSSWSVTTVPTTISPGNPGPLKRTLVENRQSRPAGISHLFESDTSFSTVGSSHGSRVGTTESFNSSTSTPFVQGLEQYSHSDEQHQGMALCRREDPSSNFSDEDILVVDTSRISRSSDIMEDNENEAGRSDEVEEVQIVNKEMSTERKHIKLHDLDHSATEEKIMGANPGCATRSPIPEETPTSQINLYQSNNTILTGANSYSISAATAVTNNCSQNQHGCPPPPAPPQSTTTGNTPSNSNPINNSCNNSLMSSATASQKGTGGVVTPADVVTPLSVSNSSNNGKGVVVARDHDSDAAVAHPASSRVASLEESAATCLDSSPQTQPPPPHPSSSSDPPPHNHQQPTNGLAGHHNHPVLHHQRGISREDTFEGTDAEDTGLQFTAPSTDKNGAATSAGGSGRNVLIPKMPSVGGSTNGTRGPPISPSPYVGPNHSNMTTTIITSGTGTLPMVMGGLLHRRSSESDLSTPPKPTTMSSHIRGFPTTSASGLKPSITTTIDQYGLMEYPFITISQFPPGFLTHIGGTVTARSVKLLERISNLDEPESRDAWWNEIRMEIRAHCRAFGCTVVVGYEEHTTMCDDVCVLSASGTAAIAVTTIGLKNVELLTVSTKQGTPNPVITDAPCPGRGVEKDRGVLVKMDSLINSATVGGNVCPYPGSYKHILATPSKLRHDSDHDSNCSLLHIPSSPTGLPFPVKMSRCHVCRKGRVPDVLIVTVDIPPGLQITGKGTLIQAQVFRPKKDCKGEISAKEVSDSLPFLEYELHRRLINKLKVKGMNAIFGLKVQICLGDRLMVAVATGTAMYVAALPPPGVPIITAGNLKTDAQKVLQYQKVVQDVYDRNRQHYDLKSVPAPTNGRQSGSSGEESDEDENGEIQSSNKDTYILEVDDAEDIDIISMLIDPHPTTTFLMNNIDYLHGYEECHVSGQQMFTQVWRCRIPTLSLRQFTAYFERLIRSVCFKLRKMMPCVLSKLSFRVELPEPDEMQISIIGLALGMGGQPKIAEKLAGPKAGLALSVTKEESELIFPLEDDTAPGGSAGVKSDGAVAASESIVRGTPPPSGILGSAGHGSSGNVIVLPKHLPHQPSAISSSSHSYLGSQQLSGNGNKVNGSGSAVPLPNLAPQLTKCVSGDSAGNLASSSNSIPPAHGHSYSLRGGSAHSQQPFSLSRSGSKVISKSALAAVASTPSRPKLIVEITPLAYIPGAKIEKYLGNLNFFFIRETTSIRENGGLSGFVHNFVAEILAIVRAHVAALGGNAMVSYFMTELALLHNPHKNQGQCLINVGGDVVLIVQPSSVADDSQQGS